MMIELVKVWFVVKSETHNTVPRTGESKQSFVDFWFLPNTPKRKVISRMRPRSSQQRRRGKNGTSLRNVEYELSSGSLFLRELSIIWLRQRIGRRGESM